jgi:anti-anti-sigma regulatory factor
MKKCPYCGESIPDASYYCAKCGEVFADSDPAKFEPLGQQIQRRTAFTIETDKIEGEPPITVVILSGTIDAGGAGVLQGALRKYTIDTAPRVLIDFANVPMVCSAGYSALVGWARERESDKPNTVAIIGINKRVMQELRTMGIVACLPIFDDRESALHALTSAE